MSLIPPFIGEAATISSASLLVFVLLVMMNI